MRGNKPAGLAKGKMERWWPPSNGHIRPEPRSAAAYPSFGQSRSHRDGDSWLFYSPCSVLADLRDSCRGKNAVHPPSRQIRQHNRCTLSKYLQIHRNFQRVGLRLAPLPLDRSLPLRIPRLQLTLPSAKSNFCSRFYS